MARVGVLLLVLLCAVTPFVASQDAPATPTTALQQVSHAPQQAKAPPCVDTTRFSTLNTEFILFISFSS